MEGFLSVKEVIIKYIDGCQAKVSMKNWVLLGKSIFAGLMIAMGAAGSSVAAHNIANVGLARLAAAVVFPVGLMMVILLGAELFTGDCLICMSVMDKKQKWTSSIRVLVIVWLGNLIGASLLSLLVYFSGQLDYSGGLLGAYTIKVAMGKANISFGTGIVSGILCNILVCAAVLMALAAKDVTGKLLASFFTIMLFVTAGFEHCVANMYYITAGLLAKCNPDYVKVAMDTYGYTKEQLASLNLTNYVIGNLLPVTIGNILGGMVFLGIPLYFLNVNRKNGQ